ncbi:DNA cytosine methyltransferase [Rhizobium sp. S152]|uniref:DNA cytosine methyltransferase n=1 Tax=Rhizobium sp. S152 TaxID=3055038 RepID=UPI0025AA1FF7|nr:DNA cytosine methyltransferase [Rhizobium sp. S152]MDM9627617.1 DNA cytosine methyltransferase [Rhizobium sp. S152]
MAVPPRVFAPHVQEQIKDARNAVIEHRKQRTAALLKIIEDDLPKFADEGREAMARLLENDGVHRRHVRGYLDIPRLLVAYRKAMNVSRFDIETAVALVGLGEAARREVMRFVERSQPTDSVEVRRIGNRWRERCKSDDESTYHDVMGLLARRRIRALRKEGMTFSRVVPKLHDLMIGYDDKSEEQQEVIRPKIIEMAIELRERFQKEYGTQSVPVEDWGKIENRAERALAECDYALKVLANGEFLRELPSIVPDRDFPMPLFSIGKYLRSWHAIDSIGFLSRRAKTSSTRYAKRPLERLSSVDICGGIGSGALALKSAGFYPNMLLDGDKKNVDSFLANRRGWRALKVDIDRKKRAAVAMRHVTKSLRGKELDLMIGALPKKQWRAKGPGLNYEGELHSAAMKMVGALKPRAFFFEHNPDMASEKHAEFYIPMMTFFAEQGYHTTVFELYHPEFGIPQDRTSSFLVGIKREFADQLRHPIIRDPVFPTVAQLIENVAFPFRTVESYEEIKGESSPETHYNNWSSAWLRTHGQRLAGNLSGAWTKRNWQHWEKFGFDLFQGDEPIERGDQPHHNLIPLTPVIIKALQGLPPNWNVRAADLRDEISMLCLATPPVITAAVARSVHAALTGDEVDLNAEGALAINNSPFLHHPFNVDDMGNAKGQLASLWRTGVLRMRGELPTAMADDDPDLSKPPEDLHLGQGKIRMKKRPS